MPVFEITSITELVTFASVKLENKFNPNNYVNKVVKTLNITPIMLNKGDYKKTDINPEKFGLREELSVWFDYVDPKNPIEICMLFYINDIYDSIVENLTFTKKGTITWTVKKKKLKKGKNIFSDKQDQDKDQGPIVIDLPKEEKIVYKPRFETKKMTSDDLKRLISKNKK